MKVLIIGGDGYIGSRLAEELDGLGREVAVCDISPHEFNTDTVKHVYIRAKNLIKPLPDIVERAVDFKNYDTIIYLAGHSSVPMCNNDPDGAMKNNVDEFRAILESLADHQFMIYASTSSIYSQMRQWSATDPRGFELDGFHPGGIYDTSMYIRELMARLHNETVAPNTLGLRFGTVCGWSPNWRTDIMINKMFMSAKENGELHIQNPTVESPILSIEHLCEAVEMILWNHEYDIDHARQLRWGEHPGVINLASFNTTVLDIGTTVSNILNVPLRIDTKVSDTYNFVASLDHMREKKLFLNGKFDAESIVKDIEAHWPIKIKGDRV